MIDSLGLQALSSGGLILVGAYLVYYVTKRHKELEDFINKKLTSVVENNTKVMQELVTVINEMRHEMKEEFRRINDKINES